MFNFINDIELLTNFITVTESSTLLQAAKAQKVSQATVSIRLRKLQEQFDFPLYEKRGRKIGVLPAGIELKDTIQHSLREAESSISKFHIRKNLNRLIPIRIGARREVFIKLGTTLKADFPVEFLPMNSLETKAALLASQIDVAITHVRPESHEFIASPLFVDSFVFCYPKKWNDGLTTLTCPQLANFVQKHRTLDYGRQSKLLNDVFRYFKVPAENVRAAAIIEDWTLLRNFLINGSGFGVFPKTFVQNLRGETEQIPIATKIIPPLRFYYVYKSEFRQNLRFKELGSLINRAFSRQGSPHLGR